MKYLINNEALDKLQLLDPMTFNHCVRSKDIAKEFEHKFNLEDNLLSQSALLHDIGKIYIPQKIIGKPGKLTPLEREIIDMHPYYGYELLRSFGIHDKICQVVLYHHGTSPPMLQPLDIEIEKDVKRYALMLHTIDAFEALTTDRSYRRGFAQEDAIEIMDKEANHDKDVLAFLHAHSFYVG